MERGEKGEGEEKGSKEKEEKGSEKKGEEKGKQEKGKEEKEGTEKEREEKEKVERPSVDLQALVREIGDLKAQVSMLKELQKNIEEKTTSMAERIGELRSSLIEKDRTFGEALLSFKKIGEIVYELEPQKLVEERRKLEGELSLLKSKVTEYEEIIRNILKEFREIKEIFSTLKNMEALIEVAKDIGNKLVKINEIKNELERYMHKVETLYSDMELKIGELPVFLDKVKRLDSLTLEIVKSLDEIKVQMKNFVTSRDYEELQKRIGELEDKIEKVRLEAAERKITLKEEEELKKVLSSVNEEIESIQATLKLVEEQYKDALISRRVYEEVTKKSKDRLEILKEVKSGITDILERGRTRGNEIKEIISKIKTVS